MKAILFATAFWALAAFSNNSATAECGNDVTPRTRTALLESADALTRGPRRDDTWYTGLRRQQSKSRANLQPVEAFTLKSGRVLRKVSPLAAWTTRDVWQYAKLHDIPLLPLYELGYSSIGCEPCTSLPEDPGYSRSGRWGGQKLECGIHIQPAKT